MASWWISLHLLPVAPHSPFYSTSLSRDIIMSSDMDLLPCKNWDTFQLCWIKEGPEVWGSALMLVLVSSLRAQTHKVPSATFLLSRRRNAAIKIKVKVEVTVKVKKSACQWNFKIYTDIYRSTPHSELVFWKFCWNTDKVKFVMVSFAGSNRNPW